MQIFDVQTDSAFKVFESQTGSPNVHFGDGLLISEASAGTRPD